MRATLEAKPRAPMSKGAVKRLRKEGLIPITVSMRGEQTQAFTVPAREFHEIVRRGGRGALIQLKGVTRGAGALVIARDLQYHPISHQVIHVGFQRISARDPITAEVRVMLIGEPEPVRAKEGVLEHELNALQVRALPDKLPGHIDVDVSGMQINDKIHVSDITPPPGCELVSPPDAIVAVLHVVRAAVTPEGEPESEAAEEQAAEAPAGEEQASES